MRKARKKFDGVKDKTLKEPDKTSKEPEESKLRILKSIKDIVPKTPVTKELTIKKLFSKNPVEKESVAEAPLVKESDTQEAVLQEPVKESTTKEGTGQETVTEESVVKESVVEEPVIKEMAADETSALDPSEIRMLNWEKKRLNEKTKRKKILLTWVLVSSFLLALCAGISLIYIMRGKSFDTIEHPYDVVTEFSNPVVSGAHQRSEGFAADLCVLERDVPMESSLLESQQKGLLFDLDSKEVLFAQGAFEKVYPASITKIMTAMLALKYGNMGDSVTVSEENLQLEAGSQVCGFWAGDTVTMEQLLNCLLVYSGNDAAGAIAEHIGGTTEDFVALMNAYAKELGCTGTHFTNPHGLHDENHYTTIYDIYLMLKEALNYPEFTAITQQPYYTLNYTRVDGSEASIYLEATDHYLTGESIAPKDITVLGGKTGTTDLAGNCLALLSQDAYGKPYCSIVMGAKEKDLLYEQMNSLLQRINQ